MTYFTGYDSTTPKSIPANAGIIFQYINGRYAYDAKSLFPHAVVKTIDVIGSRIDADFADVERYDLTASGGADWAHRKWAARSEVPGLYCSVSTLSELYPLVSDIPTKWWIADPGFLHMYNKIPNVVATQCITVVDRNYDISAVEPSYIYTASNTIKTEDDMDKYFIMEVASGAAWLIMGNKITGLYSAADADAWKNAGVPVVSVSDQMAGNIRQLFGWVPGE